jgi:hypothetical protein
LPSRSPKKWEVSHDGWFCGKSAYARGFNLDILEVFNEHKGLRGNETTSVFRAL